MKPLSRILGLALLLAGAASFVRADFGFDLDEQGNFVGGGRIKTRHDEEPRDASKIAEEVKEKAQALRDKERARQSGALSDLPFYFDDRKVPSDRAQKIKDAIKNFLGIDAAITIERAFNDPAAFDQKGIIRVNIPESVLSEDRVIGLTLRGKNRLGDYVLSDIDDKDGYQIRHGSMGVLWRFLSKTKREFGEETVEINFVGATSAGSVIVIMYASGNGFALVFDDALKMRSGDSTHINGFRFNAPLMLTEGPQGIYTDLNKTGITDTRKLRYVTPDDGEAVYWSFDGAVVKPLL